MRPARETIAGFRNLGDASLSALFETARAGGAELPLAKVPGKGLTTFDLGLPRLSAHAAQMGMNAEGVAYVERLAAEQYAKAVKLTESPIERSMIAALLTGRWAGCDTIPPRIHDTRKEALELLPLGDVIIVPQMAFVRFRLDFGVVIERAGERKMIAIECDGAQFHTDAAHERFRDGYLRSWSIPTFRFKGSEIYEDVLTAADELIAAICMWKAS